MQEREKSGNNLIFAAKILIITCFLRRVLKGILVVGASGGNPKRLFSFPSLHFFNH
jgi:hypothetical protein